MSLVIPNFAEKVEGAVDCLTGQSKRDLDENEFIDASRLVYDGVRDIRRAVLANRAGVRISKMDWCDISINNVFDNRYVPLMT